MHFQHHMPHTWAQSLVLTKEEKSVKGKLIYCYWHSYQDSHACTHIHRNTYREQCVLQAIQVSIWREDTNRRSRDEIVNGTFFQDCFSYARVVVACRLSLVTSTVFKIDSKTCRKVQAFLTCKIPDNEIYCTITANIINYCWTKSKWILLM